uniref:Putative secreted peptide n=1 Tax=Anopheles braziliensis TaxID=58242 RepID=A0A2M3ZQM4_9DIPT
MFYFISLVYASSSASSSSAVLVSRGCRPRAPPPPPGRRPAAGFPPAMRDPTGLRGDRDGAEDITGRGSRAEGISEVAN